MISIFNTEIEANTFSNKIHNFLIENREGYNAEKWSNPNKSDKEEKWMVKIPYDFEKWTVKLDVKTVTKISTLPIDWKDYESIIKIDPIIKK